MDFYPNIFTTGFFLLVLIISSILIVKLFIFDKYLVFKKNLIPLILLLIPFFDLTFGMSNQVRDLIKGEIVFNAIDDTPFKTKSIIVREKRNHLFAYLYVSVAGLGGMEEGKIVVEGNTLIISLNDRDYSEKLIFNRNKNIMEVKNSGAYYRILSNKLLK